MRRMLLVAFLASLLVLVMANPGMATNLVQNGSFESGSIVPAISDYHFDDDGWWPDPSFAVGTSPVLYNYRWGDFPAYDGSLMMIVNCASLESGKRIWVQTVPIVPFHTYLWESYVRATYPDNPAQLEFLVGGDLVSALVVSDTTGWTKVTGTWTAPAGVSSVDLTIIDRLVIAHGDDFALDNISFTDQTPNQPPTGLWTEAQFSTEEGASFSASGSFADTDSTGWTATVDYGDGSPVQPLTLAANKTFQVDHTYADNGTYQVTVAVTDDAGGEGQGTATVTVTNVAPTIGPIDGPAGPLPLTSAVTLTLTAYFTDPGILDTHTALWEWGDSSPDSPGTLAEVDGSGSVVGGHTYAEPGIYRVSVTVTDKDGASASQSLTEYVVVYDPSAGFVTGGGWITSPVGAYLADPSLSGRANFGFVSKYQKGGTSPVGQTEFQFKLGGLNFHSTNYDWLVVSGSRACYKGSGTINGVSDYGFLLSVLDGQASGGGGADKFRIKIWDKTTDVVIYDNQVEGNDAVAPVTELGGGSIVIHKA